jgi:hypothetical protein
LLMPAQPVVIKSAQTKRIIHFVFIFPPQKKLLKTYRFRYCLTNFQLFLLSSILLRTIQALF